jgi:hypothetical protein
LHNTRRNTVRSAFFFSALSLSIGAVAFACGGVSPDGQDLLDDNGDGGSGDGSSSTKRDSGTAKKDAGCTGIGCNVVDCAGAADTTISGVAYAPNGTTPLYNVIVFVPSSTTKLPPLADSLSCDQCGSVEGDPVTSTTTDGTGHFTLHHVPAGTSIPVVFQLGKWRREIYVTTVTKCTDNPITDPNLSRLPKNQTEGDMPHIAVSAGKCDSTACLLPKLGIDSAEYGTAADIDTKKVIFYAATGAGAPAGAAAASTLWSDETQLKKFDAVILGCNCTEDATQNPDAGAGPMLAGMADYLGQGGRVLSLDFQYPWIEYGPAPEPSTMQSFVGGAPEISESYSIDDSTAKGAAAKLWLTTTDPTKTYTGGAITLGTVFGNFGHVDSTLAQGWVKSDVHDVVMSYTAPLSKPAAQRCGKMAYFDGHVTGAGTVDSTFPAACSAGFTQEQLLYTFFFMDLFSCVQDDTQSVVAP